MPVEYIVPISTVVAAALALLGVIIVHKTRQPVATQDLWEENRQLRAEVRSLSDRINSIEDKFDLRDTERQRVISILTLAMNALLSYLERVRMTWGQVEMPEYTATQQHLIDEAMSLQRPTDLQ